MINRQMLMRKIETLNDPEVAEVLEYISIMESVREQFNCPDPLEETLLGLLLQALRDEDSWPAHVRRHQRALTN